MFKFKKEQLQYQDELNSSFAKIYLEETLQKYNISKKKLIDLLIEERENSKDMMEAAEKVDSRLSYLIF